MTDSSLARHSRRQKFHPQMNADYLRWHSLISYLRLSAQICGYKAVEKEMLLGKKLSADCSIEHAASSEP